MQLWKVFCMQECKNALYLVRWLIIFHFSERSRRSMRSGNNFAGAERLLTIEIAARAGATSFRESGATLRSVAPTVAQVASSTSKWSRDAWTPTLTSIVNKALHLSRRDESLFCVLRLNERANSTVYTVCYRMHGVYIICFLYVTSTARFSCVCNGAGTVKVVDPISTDATV